MLSTFLAVLGSPPIRQTWVHISHLPQTCCNSGSLKALKPVSSPVKWETRPTLKAPCEPRAAAEQWGAAGVRKRTRGPLPGPVPVCPFRVLGQIALNRGFKRGCISSQSRGQKSKIKVWWGLMPSGAPGEGPSRLSRH